MTNTQDQRDRHGNICVTEVARVVYDEKGRLAYYLSPELERQCRLEVDYGEAVRAVIGDYRNAWQEYRKRSRAMFKMGPLFFWARVAGKEIKCMYHYRDSADGLVRDRIGDKSGRVSVLLATEAEHRAIEAAAKRMVVEAERAKVKAENVAARSEMVNPYAAGDILYGDGYRYYVVRAVTGKGVTVQLVETVSTPLGYTPDVSVSVGEPERKKLKPADWYSREPYLAGRARHDCDLGIKRWDGKPQPHQSR